MPKKTTTLIAALLTTLLTASAFAKDDHDHHAHHFARDVNAFHAVLAPLWHAPAGKERTQNVCAQAGKLASVGSKIRSGDAKPLLASITALKAQCQANPAGIDAAFSQVHDAFHQLAVPKGR